MAIVRRSRHPPGSCRGCPRTLTAQEIITLRAIFALDPSHDPSLAAVNQRARKRLQFRLSDIIGVRIGCVKAFP